MDPPTHNLPIQVTRFIGRDQELAELQRLLPATRLLTLTGSGGTGKTRLALELAAVVFGNYRDGVWFVDLAPLSDPSLVPLTLAAVLGVREEQSDALVATLVEWLRPRQLLLILDNCEHLINACAVFADAVLHGCREIGILATSREALGIAGERAWRVPSLQFPSPAEFEGTGPDPLGSGDHAPVFYRSSPASPGEPKGAPAQAWQATPLQAYASVRLFVERATFANAAFRLTDANAPAVAQICYRLDGIPLAIELAAARVKVMRVKQIAERLDDRFHLLTGGSRTALPRQQTLRGAIDWSYGLLAEPERILLRRLSVFAGGWTLEAAEDVSKDDPRRSPAEGLGGGMKDEVTKDEGGRMKAELLHPSAFIVHPSDVLDLLTHLVDKSLVVLDEQAADTRYHLLETIRRYAHEKLLEAGEGSRLRDRHLAYFLKLAERAEAPLQSAQRIEWIPRLEAELGNLRAALDWACAQDLEAARMLAGRLSRFWYSCDHHGEALSWYERILRPGEHAAETEGLGLALLGAGSSSIMLLAFHDAQTYLEQGVAVWQALNDKARLARALVQLSIVKIHQGNHAGACAIFAANESLFRHDAGPYSLGIALTYWGIALATERGDYAAAKPLHEQSLAIGRSEGDTYILALASVHLGKLATQQGDFTLARKYVDEGLAWSQQMGPRPNIAITQCQVADVAYLQGDYAEARTLYEEALASYRAKGDRAFVAHSSTGLGYLAVRQGRLGPAAAIFAEDLTIVRKGQFELDVARCLAGYADLRLAQGCAAQAVRLLASELVSSHCRSSLAPVDLIRYEHTLAAARAALDPAAFAAAWQAGRQLTVEQAIALAQSEPQTPLAPATALAQSELQTSPAAAMVASSPVPANIGGLSAREREVAVLVARGLTNRAIADELVLSERTIEGHVRNILSKLTFQSRAQIAAWAVGHGLVNPGGA